MGITVYPAPTQTVEFGSAGYDAFGRIRVSNTSTLFDSKQVFDNAPLLWDDQAVSGTGTSSSHSTATASSTIGVSNATAGKRVRQSFQWFNYQPGKSQLIYMTGVLNLSGGGTGIKQGFGYYNDDNGIFWQNNEGTLQFVKRSSTSGSAVDTEVNQSSWNIDKFDGTGPSGVTIDASKANILVIDMEWLGTGRVRVGFVVSGKILYAHAFDFANTLTAVYMSTPNLPVRYEIENDGNGGAATLMHICSTVISEGGQEKIGFLQHQDSNQVSGLAAGTAYALLGGRLKSGYLGATVMVERVSVVGSTNDLCDWELVMEPTVAGTFTYNDKTNSAVQVAVGTSSNTVTGGTVIDGGFFSTNLATTVDAATALHPGSYIDGTPQEWVLIVRPITNNISLKASVTWRELL